MNFAKYIAEFVGTAIFLAIIIKSRGDKYVVIAGLLAAILIMGDVSGGNFNPAVSLMLFLRGELTGVDLTGYVVAQLLGAVAATQVIRLNTY